MPLRVGKLGEGPNGLKLRKKVVAWLPLAATTRTPVVAGAAVVPPVLPVMPVVAVPSPPVVAVVAVASPPVLAVVAVASEPPLAVVAVASPPVLAVVAVACVVPALEVVAVG